MLLHLLESVEIRGAMKVKRLERRKGGVVVAMHGRGGSGDGSGGDGGGCGGGCDDGSGGCDDNGVGGGCGGFDGGGCFGEAG